MASASGYEPHGLQSTAQNKSETGASQAQDEKEDDAPTEPPAQQANPVASEDYSVFTVNQKRSIILAGSFIGWFSPMSGSIYYPALNQVRHFDSTVLYHPGTHSILDCGRSGRFQLKSQHNCDNIFSEYFDSCVYILMSLC